MHYGTPAWAAIILFVLSIYAGLVVGHYLGTILGWAGGIAALVFGYGYADRTLFKSRVVFKRDYHT